MCAYISKMFENNNFEKENKDEPKLGKTNERYVKIINMWAKYVIDCILLSIIKVYPM